MSNFVEECDAATQILITQHLEALEGESIRYFPDIQSLTSRLVRAPFTTPVTCIPDDNDDGQTELLTEFETESLTVFWSSMATPYHAQFELLAQGQGWSAQEKALQLVASLRGPALEILAHMTVSQRSSYIAVVEALRRRFGSVFQAEVYREQLKGRTRRPGESLPQLAQAVESLVRHAIPSGPGGDGDGTVPERLYRCTGGAAGADLCEAGAPSRCAAGTSKGYGI